MVRTGALLLIGFVACAGLRCRADDGSVQGAGGVWHFMGGKHPDVQMVRETVRLELGDGDYDVAADFWFYNHGEKQVVPMGFPEIDGGDIDPQVRDGKAPGFIDFKSWADGKPLSVRHVKDSGDDLTALWIKNVPFEHHQTRHVRVTYSAPFGDESGGGDIKAYINRWAYYDFTGGNWRDDVEDCVLTIVLGANGAQGAYFFDDSGFPPYTRHGNTLEFHWRHWNATLNFKFPFRRTTPGWMEFADPADLNQVPSQSPGHAPHSPYISTTAAWLTHTPAGFDYWPAPAVIRNGITYIRLQALSSWLGAKLSYDLDPESEGDTYEVLRHPSGPVTLRGGTVNFRFVPGSPVLLRDGSPVKMAQPSMLIADRLYVPLPPLLPILHLAATAEPQNHRLYLRFSN